MKLYFNTVGILAYILLTVGLILPYLISSDSTELVLLGILIGVASPALLYTWIKTTLMTKKTKETE